MVSGLGRFFGYWGYSFVVHNWMKEETLIYFLEKDFLNKLKGTLIVPIALVFVLLSFSHLIGWSLITLFLFWFVLTPGLTIYLPTIVSKRKNHLYESLIGLIIFYTIMIFMIYDHYKSNYFQIMILSGMINIIIVFVISWTQRSRIEAK